jgi:hypothetical protein
MAATKTVTFRLTEEELERLEKRAKDDGKSAGVWAKERAFEKLDEQASTDELRDRLISVEAAVEKMSQELRFSVDAILLTLGSMKPDLDLTAEKIQKWRATKLKT